MHRLRPAHERRTESAFTLIELLVVMIIVGILMAIAIPTFLAQKSTAMRTQALANIDMVVKAVESCSHSNTATTGDYSGCADQRWVWEYEDGLNSVKRMGIDGPVASTPGGIDVDALDATGRVTNVTTRTDPAAGYVISTWIQDGDRRIWFARSVIPDGRVVRACGAGTSDTATPVGGVPNLGAPVPGSRACTTGTW